VKLLLWTRDDPASLRLAGALVAAGHFQAASDDGSVRVDAGLDAALFRVEGSLLQADFADRRVGALPPGRFERALFLSKHSAASGTTAFTVHPIGNLGSDVSFGGGPRTLAPADPAAQTSLLNALTAEGRPIEVPATFEATHHGPQMAIPSLFVEVGSRPQDWESALLCEAVARAVVTGYLKADLRVPPSAAIGLGGGHYHPRQTDRARRDGVPVGHLIPGYALADLDAPTLEQAVALSGARVALVDRKREASAALDRALTALGRRGLSCVFLGEWGPPSGNI